MEAAPQAAAQRILEDTLVTVAGPHYGGTIDPRDSNDPRSRIVAMVRSGSHVLEVGCGSGTILGYLVRTRQCSGVGVERDQAMAEEAQALGIEVLQLDVEQEDAWPGIAARGPYDYVILADVLEHLRRPDIVLTAAHQWLRPTGELLLSVPNVAYWRIRLSLLFGRWEYTDGFIMDRSHLRWFTTKTIIQLLTSAGYRVTEVQHRWAPLPGERLWRVLFASRGRFYAWLVSRWPALFCYQFVLRARSEHGQSN